MPDFSEESWQPVLLLVNVIEMYPLLNLNYLRLVQNWCVYTLFYASIYEFERRNLSKFVIMNINSWVLQQDSVIAIVVLV